MLQNLYVIVNQIINSGPLQTSRMKLLAKIISKFYLKSLNIFPKKIQPNWAQNFPQQLDAT